MLNFQPDLKYNPRQGCRRTGICKLAQLFKLRLMYELLKKLGKIAPLKCGEKEFERKVHLFGLGLLMVFLGL